MTSTCKKISFMALLALCIYVPDASALTIVTHFIGGAAPGNAVGGGNLNEIVNTAAHIWESAFSDPTVIDLYYGWAKVGDAGTHTIQQSDGMDREISGTMLFDNTGSVSFYLDPTPEANEEYKRRTEEYQDLGSGLVNVARIFGNPVGDASGHIDLLSVALHEIGHALGLSAGNVRFVRQSANGAITVSPEYPFQGAVIPLTYNKSGIVPHIDPNEIIYGSLMSGVNGDERRIPSELDVLANAQVSGFTVATLHPQQASALEVSRSRGLQDVEPGLGNRTRNRVALNSISSTPLSFAGSQSAR
jgi:hypothetical protein